MKKTFFFTCLTLFSFFSHSTFSQETLFDKVTEIINNSTNHKVVLDDISFGDTTMYFVTQATEEEIKNENPDYALKTIPKKDPETGIKELTPLTTSCNKEKIAHYKYFDKNMQQQFLSFCLRDHDQSLQVVNTEMPTFSPSFHIIKKLPIIDECSEIIREDRRDQKPFDYWIDFKNMKIGNNLNKNDRNLDHDSEDESIDESKQHLELQKSCSSINEAIMQNTSETKKRIALCEKQFTCRDANPMIARCLAKKGIARIHEDRTTCPSLIECIRDGGIKAHQKGLKREPFPSSYDYKHYKYTSEQCRNLHASFKSEPAFYLSIHNIEYHHTAAMALTKPSCDRIYPNGLPICFVKKIMEKNDSECIIQQSECLGNPGDTCPKSFEECEKNKFIFQNQDHFNTPSSPTQMSSHPNKSTSS